jgi:hypothetical protein
MTIADALSAAQEAVVKAITAADVDIGTAETSAVLGTAQASVAYQLAMQILQDQAVELAPALITVEIAAINEGIAAYLAEKELSMATERDLETKTAQAFEQVQAAFETTTKDLDLELLNLTHGAESDFED